MHSFAVIGVEHNSGDGSRFLRYKVTSAPRFRNQRVPGPSRQVHLLRRRASRLQSQVAASKVAALLPALFNNSRATISACFSSAELAECFGDACPEGLSGRERDRLGQCCELLGLLGQRLELLA